MIGLHASRSARNATRCIRLLHEANPALAVCGACPEAWCSRLGGRRCTIVGILHRFGQTERDELLRAVASELGFSGSAEDRGANSACRHGFAAKENDHEDRFGTYFRSRLKRLHFTESKSHPCLLPIVSSSPALAKDWGVARSRAGRSWNQENENATIYPAVGNPAWHIVHTGSCCRNGDRGTGSG